MSEEKSFEATQSRLARAQREGDVARSYELNALAAFIAATLMLAIIAKPLAMTMQLFIGNAFHKTVALGLLVQFAACAIAPLCAGCIGAAVSAFLQGGLKFVAVTPKFERLSPSENFKRILSRETLVTAARATMAFVCAALAIFPILRSTSSAAGGGSLGTLAAMAWNGSLHVAAAVCIAAGIFVGTDYGLQLHRWRRRLRMSADELRRDRKENDGDPLAKSRRSSLHRQFARGSLSRVKDAAVVICNPEHIAIALEYRPPQVPVPRVLVRAADDIAVRVREIARSCSIPLIENVGLARLLYETAPAGDWIPPQAYLAVAQIVAHLGLANA